jgi:hypothetical protein
MKTAKKEKRRKIAHIIQPAIVDKSSDLFVAQPITFETMKIAQKLAQEQVDVTLYYARFFDENISMPEEFQATRDLKRSILDIAAFEHKRKLPLLKDILDRLYEAASEAEYLIYTNVDIALMPQFYLVVNELIEKGYDAFIINRRTISQTYQSVSDIPFMYCEIGKSHPGQDCFVFKRNVYPNYFLGNVCIGTRYIGKALLFNLICHAVQFEKFKALHLTFHLGNDKIWSLAKKNKDYWLYNFNELKKIVNYYQESQKLPVSSLINKIMAKITNAQIPGHKNILKATIGVGNDKKAYNISPITEMDIINPQQLETMIHQVVAQLNTNQNVEALRLLEIILAMQPELIGLQYNKALALARLKRIDEAIELLSRFSIYRPAKLLLDELLSKNQTPSKSLVKKHVKNEKLLIFVHIPKAGGTTLKSIISKNYAEDTIFKRYHLKNETCTDILQKLSVQEIKKIKCYAGHFRFGIHEHLPYPATYITLLRHPVHRIISFYYYILREKNHPFHDELIEKQMTLKDFVVSERAVVTNNQTRNLAGLISSFPVSRDDLSIAKQNLKKHFLAVGTTEKFDDFLLMLQQRLGWQDIAYHKKHVTYNRPRIEDIPGDVLKLIKERNELDLELYEFVKNQKW